MEAIALRLEAIASIGWRPLIWEVGKKETELSGPTQSPSVLFGPLRSPSVPFGPFRSGC